MATGSVLLAAHCSERARGDTFDGRAPGGRACGAFLQRNPAQSAQMMAQGCGARARCHVQGKPKTSRRRRRLAEPLPSAAHAAAAESRSRKSAERRRFARAALSDREGAAPEGRLLPLLVGLFLLPRWRFFCSVQRKCLAAGRLRDLAQRRHGTIDPRAGPRRLGRELTR